LCPTGKVPLNDSALKISNGEPCHAPTALQRPRIRFRCEGVDGDTCCHCHCGHGVMDVALSGYTRAQHRSNLGLKDSPRDAGERHRFTPVRGGRTSCADLLGFPQGKHSHPATGPKSGPRLSETRDTEAKSMIYLTITSPLVKGEVDTSFSQSSPQAPKSLLRAFSRAKRGPLETQKSPAPGRSGSGAKGLDTALRVLGE
jgi:hypothetical protein